MLSEWIRARASGFLNSQDHTAEVNLGAYALGVLAGIAWLSYWFFSGPRDVNLVAAFSAFLAAITGGLFKKGSNAAASKGTENQKGEHQ
jgi:hypothetical protein